MTVRWKRGCRYKEFRYGVLFLPLPHNWFLLLLSAISSGSRVVLCGVGGARGRAAAAALGSRERRIVLQRRSTSKASENKCHSCHSEGRLD